MVLRASVALHGRSVTLYEKAFPLSEQCSKKAHDQFLADLASILPSNTTPLIVSDAGFKVPWYKSVEKLGWYWLSRVRGKVQYADLGAENWKPISNLHDMSSSHSKTLGYKRLTKSNPISCQILLYKSRSKGRKNQRSTRTHCHHPSPKIYSASAKEPWILATNLPVEIRTPKQLLISIRKNDKTFPNPHISISAKKSQNKFLVFRLNIHTWLRSAPNPR